MLQKGWSEANASPASRHGYRRLLHQSDGNHTSVEVYVSVISTLKHQRCRIFCFWKFVSLHPICKIVVRLRPEPFLSIRKYASYYRLPLLQRVVGQCSELETLSYLNFRLHLNSFFCPKAGELSRGTVCELPPQVQTASVQRRSVTTVVLVLDLQPARAAAVALTPAARRFGDDALEIALARDAIGITTTFSNVTATDRMRVPPMTTIEQDREADMKAIVVTDQAAGTAGMTLVERPEPQAAINDVVVQVHASGFVPTELAWPSTWTDRLDRDRRPSIPGHELAGVVTALGYGTRGLSVGQRVFGLTDWYRNGTLAEYAAVEARNLAPLPGDVDFTVGASLPISGLTAWQGLFEHGRLQAGRSVLVHGAAGAVGSMVTQLAREAGAYVIGTGRAADRQTVLDFGAKEFVGLDNDALEDVGEVDLVFDVIGGDIGRRSAGLVRAGGTLVSIVGPPEARPADGLAVDFVVESDRAQLSAIVQRVRDGRLRTNIGNVSTLDDAVAAFNRTERRKGKTIIRVRP